MSKYYGFEASGFGGWPYDVDDVVSAKLGGFLSGLNDVSMMTFDDADELKEWAEEVVDDFGRPERGDRDDFADDGSLIGYDTAGGGWDSPTWLVYCWIDEETYNDYLSEAIERQEKALADLRAKLSK